MTAQTYGGSTAADVQAILSNVPVSTKNQIIQALQANGLLGPHTHIGVVSEVNPGLTTDVPRGNQLVLLSPGSGTEVNSAQPVVIGLDSGTNYVVLGFDGRSGAGDTIVGGSGHDVIFGNGDADSLVAGSGSERIASGGGKDTIRGGSGHDTLSGGGQSMIYAGSGPTTIKAGMDAGSYSGTPHDTIQAGTGKDSITLASGNNIVYAPTAGGQATINAGSGNDTIYGPTQFQGAETINSGGHTTLSLDTGGVTYNLKSNGGSNDTIFGGSNTGTAYVSVNQAVVSTAPTTLGGQNATVYTFAGGSTITTTGTVNIVPPKTS